MQWLRYLFKFALEESQNSKINLGNKLQKCTLLRPNDILSTLFMLPEHTRYKLQVVVVSSVLPRKSIEPINKRLIISSLEVTHYRHRPADFTRYIYSPGSLGLLQRYAKIYNQTFVQKPLLSFHELLLGCGVRSLLSIL